MKYCLLVLSFLIISPNNLFAQENSMYVESLEGYKGYLFKDFGVSFNVPENFTNMNAYNVFWKIRKSKDKRIGSMGGILLQSEDSAFMVMSAFPKDDLKVNPQWEMAMGRTGFPRGQIEGELKTALGLYYSHGHPLNNDTAKFDFNEHVTVIAGKKAVEMFNADLIYIYDIPGGDSVYFFDESLDQMRKTRYPYCTGMFISKRNRAIIGFKLFFTRRGKENEEKYIEKLKNMVWYEEGFRQERK